MNLVTTRVERCHAEAKLPVYSTEGAGGFDFFTVDSGIVLPGCSAVVRTGLKFEIPAGCALLIMGRSGLGFKNGIRLANCVGLIDCDYRGEVMLKIHNEGAEPYAWGIGARLAQGVIVPYIRAGFVEGAVSETDRGEAGFGSTGVN